MSKDSVVSDTTTLVLVSEETPLLQANSEVTKIHPELNHSNGTFSSASTTTATAATDDAEDSDATTKDDDKPLPKSQIFLLCYCRLVEPIAFFSIFPFISKMIADTGVREEDVGFYSGLIESLFSLTQMTVMIGWGRASDRFGRKPVLAISLFGMAIAVSLFGMSKTVWQMILFRCLAGIFSGTVVTLRTMFSEHSTPKTQARAFSFFAFTSNMGILFGPLIGGSLADPVTQYGGPFTKIQFFHDYPYALSSYVTGVIGLSASLVATFFVEETLKPRKTDGGKPAKKSLSTWELIRSPGVATVLFLYNLMMLLGMAFTAIVPVFYYTSVRLGGYGFSPLQISLILGFLGVSQAIWVLLVFPSAHHRWATGGVLRACGIAWPIVLLTNPICNTLLRKGFVVAFWIVMPTMGVIGSGVSMTGTCVQLALNDISPNPEVLGSLNAIALAMVSGIRAVVPALFASLYATGVRHQLLGGYFGFVILIILASGATVAVRFLPAKAQGISQRKKRTDEEEHED